MGVPPRTAVIGLTIKVKPAYPLLLGMSLEPQDRDGDSEAERLAELTDRPVVEFEYDGEIPDASEQGWDPVDDES